MKKRCFAVILFLGFCAILQANQLESIIWKDDLEAFKIYAENNGGIDNLVKNRPDVFWRSIDVGNFERISLWIFNQTEIPRFDKNKRMDALQRALWRNRNKLALAILIKWQKEGSLKPKALAYDKKSYLHLVEKKKGDAAVYEKLILGLVKAGVPLDHKNDIGRSALWYALNEKDEIKARVLIKSGASLKEPELLPMAASGSFKILKLIVDTDIEVDYCPKNKVSALFTICRNYREIDFEKIKLLLEAGADPNFKNAGNAMPLHYLMRYHRESSIKEAFKIMVRFGADINAGDRSGNTPLMYLLDRRTQSKEQKDLIDDYLAYKPNLNTGNNSGKRPIHFAAEHNLLTSSILKKMTLLEADINAVTKYGETALMYAKNYNIIKLLLDYGVDPNLTNSQGENALFKAVRIKNFNRGIFRQLCSKIDDIDYKDKYKKTALNYAVSSYVNWNYVVQLLEFGASLKAIDNGKVPVFHYAIKNSNLDVEQIRFLLDTGIDPDITNGSKQTSLYVLLNSRYQSSERLLQIANLLIKYKCDVNRKDSWNRTPIFSVRALSDSKIYKTLVAAGARTDIKDLGGNTILHFYAQKIDSRNFPDIAGMEYLDSVNSYKNTPLHIALNEHNISTAMMLIENGAALNMKNNSGKTAFDLIVNDFELLSKVISNKEANLYFTKHKEFSKEYKSAGKKLAKRKRSEKRKEDSKSCCFAFVYLFAMICSGGGH